MLEIKLYMSKRPKNEFGTQVIELVLAICRGASKLRKFEVYEQIQMDAKSKFIC